MPTGIAVDEDGFIQTDRDLTSDDLCATWSLLGRAPLPYETSAPASSPPVMCGQGR
jgi:hypothetical protein